MKTDLIKERPLYHYTGCCPEFGQEISIYADDLKHSNVGDGWMCTDQDRYPNRTREWDVTVKVVYKDEHGVALLERNDDEPMIIWVELH